MTLWARLAQMLLEHLTGRRRRDAVERKPPPATLHVPRLTPEPVKQRVAARTSQLEREVDELQVEAYMTRRELGID